MVTKKVYDGITWVDMFSPTPEEVRDVISTYNFNPDVSKNILLPSPDSRIYDYTGLMYLVLHFPLWQKKNGEVTTQEVDFLLSKKTLITIHYQPVDAIDQFSKYFEVSAILKSTDIDHAGFLFFEILKQMYTTVKDDLSGIDDELKSIEPKVFHDREKEVVKQLSVLNHALLRFQQIIASRDLLDISSTYSDQLFGTGFEKINKRIMIEHEQTSREIEYRKESLQELWNTNSALLSSKQNEVMKNLAMISFITFPLSLIVSVFDLYTNLASADGTTHYFGLLLILLLAVTGCMLIFFKRIRWI